MIKTNYSNSVLRYAELNGISRDRYQSWSPKIKKILKEWLEIEPFKATLKDVDFANLVLSMREEKSQ